MAMVACDLFLSAGPCGREAMAANSPPPTAACAEGHKDGNFAFRQWPSSNLQLYLARRGRCQQDKSGVATRFPFAFLRKMRRIALARAVVYPSVEPTNKFFHAFPLITGEFENFKRGRALVEPQASTSFIEGIDISDEYNIILTSRPRTSIPTDLLACSYFVFMELQ